jgi:hypothetical protein
MTRSTLRRTSAAAVAVLALASLAACGGDDGGDDPSSESSDSTSSDASDEVSDGASDDASDDPSEGASDDASDEASDAAEDPGAPDLNEGDEVEPSEFIDKYAGALDQATTARLVMNFGGETPVKGKGAADFTTTPPSMHLIMKDASTGQEQRMIIVDGVMYLGLEKKKYLSYDLSDPNSPLGTDLIDQLDPSSMSDVFEEGMTASRFLGEEEKQGESMEHYRVAVDAASVFSETPDGASSVTFDVWFDDEGYLRVQEAGLGAGAGSVQLSYEDWGAPVDIKAPPKSQVSQLPSS